MNEAVARNDNMCKGELTSVKQNNTVLYSTLYCTLQYYTMEYIAVMYCTVLRVFQICWDGGTTPW